MPTRTMLKYSPAPFSDLLGEGGGGERNENNINKEIINNAMEKKVRERKTELSEVMFKKKKNPGNLELGKPQSEKRICQDSECN